MEGNSGPTPLYLPHSIIYPITIQRLNKPLGGQVRKTDALFTYSFKAKKSDEPGEERLVRVWESPIQGEITKWDIQVNQVITNSSDPFIHVQEPCTHDVQLHGMCALCGKDLTATDYTGFSDTSRAAISMVHDVGGLTVSMSEASRLEAQTTARLKETKKLSLIVDLDQTIIHATVDPTVGEWLDDRDNPNFSALNNTGKFKLGDEGDDSCWYYVKSRPGLQDFLTSVSSKYEMHVYTMGTRAYAVQVCKLIDPQGKFFGGRILSRDESGSMTHKSLERLFPCETNMVVIIDDRADVWDGSPNLLKVIPFEFFPSVGDINSAFLPKRKELKPPPTAAQDKDKAASSSAASTPEACTTSDTSATVSDLVVTPTGPESVVSPSLDEAEADNAVTLHDQIEDRPLSKAQAEARTAQTPSEAADVESDLADDDDDEEVMQAILKDDDRELDRLQDILDEVHAAFFEDPEQGDIKTIIPARKRQTLRGVNLVLSGLVQLGTRPQDSEYWRLATAFGANCFADLHSKVTHLVANQGGTQKVHQARRMRGVKVVKERWLVESAARWRRLDEEDYEVEEPAGAREMVAEARMVLVTGPTNQNVFESDEEVDEEDGAEEAEEEDVDLADVGWGDANAEIDDLLNETDSDADSSRTDDGDSQDSGDDDDGDSTNGDAPLAAAASKKRTRAATAESEAEAPPPPPLKDSPLQKRVKHSRSRRSGLNVSLLAVGKGTGDGEGASEAGSENGADLAEPSLGKAGGGGGEDTDGGSTVTSDDDFGDLLADIESGFD